MLVITVLLAVLLCAASTVLANDLVILVSIDGFRADYLDRGITPTLSRLANSGARATAMEPAFPSVTFPNHYTLVTGLYPEHHGIVGNSFYDPQRKEQYTYADLRELATRAAGFFASKSLKSGDRVMLFSHNAPEWGMTYFGVLKAGATCIPVDPESSTDEIINFARAGEASGIVISAKLKEEHSDLQDKLNLAGLEAIKLWTFDDVFEMPDEKTEGARIALCPGLGYAQIDPDVQAAIRQAAGVFSDLGAKVEEVEPDYDKSRRGTA